MFTLDYVEGMIPEGIEVRGFLDSPMWVDIMPAVSTVIPLEVQTKSVFELVFPLARLGQGCIDAYNLTEQWKWRANVALVAVAYACRLLTHAAWTVWLLAACTGSTASLL